MLLWRMREPEKQTGQESWREAVDKEMNDFCLSPSDAVDRS